ncbi:MAG: FHA domain-containing protein [Armatimonadetes bacterium]|nr:FHA domain-containing protein [Armatimonadota bacterium]
MWKDLLRRLFSRLPEGELQWGGNDAGLTFEDSPELGFEAIVQRVHSLCRQALDRSTRGVLDPSQRGEAANELHVALVLSDDARAARLQEYLDSQRVDKELQQHLTRWAEEERLEVWQATVRVRPIAVKASGNGHGEIRVRWHKTREQPRREHGPEDSRLEGKSGTVEDPILEYFWLYVHDTQKGAGQWRRLHTTFYFGRSSRAPQLPLERAASEREVSGDHFSILAEERLGFVLRDTSKNGTMVRRGDRAVLLQRGSGEINLPRNELRLQRGDVIRVQYGDGQQRRGVLTMLFDPDRKSEGPPPAEVWDGSLRDLSWGRSADFWIHYFPNANRRAEPNPVVIYNGDQYLGAIASGTDVRVEYEPEHQRFHGRQALAAIQNWGRCWITWRREDVTATVEGTPLRAGESIEVRHGDLVAFEGGGLPPSLVQIIRGGG